MLACEKEAYAALLASEKATLNMLRRQYKEALFRVNERILMLQGMGLTQSRIHQIQYQRALKGQLEGILGKLRGDAYTTIDQFLQDSYQSAFSGALYSMNRQGVPVIVAMDRGAAFRAIVTDSKLSEDLYSALGINVSALKKSIRAEITRGIASGQSYADIARNLQNATKAPLANAMTIVRTEGHRIQQASAQDARMAAKAQGAEVVKQWDASLDGKTRPTHARLDGQIREVNEPFEIEGKKAMYPGLFGDPAEDCNCRCVALTRARWNLGAEELSRLEQRAAYFGLDKADSFEDFKQKYLKANETLVKSGESGIIGSDLQRFASRNAQLGKKIGKHAVDYGYDPSNSDDRAKMMKIIDDIKINNEIVKVGPWRGQKDDVVFYIKGNDVVIEKQNGEFVTIMKGGVSNERVKNARNKDV